MVMAAVRQDLVKSGAKNSGRVKQT